MQNERISRISSWPGRSSAGNARAHAHNKAANYVNGVRAATAVAAAVRWCGAVEGGGRRNGGATRARQTCECCAVRCANLWMPFSLERSEADDIRCACLGLDYNIIT